MARAADRHEAAKLLTEAQRVALRAQPCGICGEPYHRFCDHDPEHEWEPIACINSPRHHLEGVREVSSAASGQGDA